MGAETEPATAAIPPQLVSLVQSMAADDVVRAEAGDEPLPDDTADRLWNAAHRRLLRVSADARGAWYARLLDEARACGAQPDPGRAAAIAFPEESSIYQGLSGTIEARGLASLGTQALDSRLGEVPAEPDVALMARLVSTALWFCENDPELHHCLLSVYRFGIVSMAGEQRAKFIDELLRRWRRLRDRALASGPSPPDSDAKALIKDWIELDEALHSLTYLPPATPGSWWGRLLSEARLALFRARDRVVTSGIPARLQRLHGHFPAISGLASDDSLQVQFGTPGDVVLCLRVFARIGGEELRGRVLYRSL